MPALADIALELEMSPQALVYSQVDFEIAAVSGNGKIERMQAARDDKVVTLSCLRFSHPAGLVIVLSQVHRLTIDERDQIVRKSLQIVGHRVEVSHHLPHRLLPIPKVIVIA